LLEEGWKQLNPERSNRDNP